MKQVGADGKGEFVIVSWERVATAGASKRGRGNPDVVKESEYNQNDLRC